MELSEADGDHVVSMAAIDVDRNVWGRQMSEQQRTFGVELRRIREEAGLSLSALSRSVHYTKGYLSKVETSDKSPSPELARLCDAALDAGGVLVALVPQVRTPKVDPTPRCDEWAPNFAPDGTNGQLQSLAGAKDGLAAAAGEEITVDVFRALFNQAVDLGELVSSRVVLPTVTTNANTLWSLALVAPPATRSSLTTLAALNATYAGWLALETGDDHAAQWWSRTAVGLAKLVDDANLVAYTLTREAQVAVFRDDPDQVLALASGIEDDTRASARYRGIAAHRLAQAHAMMGDYDECQRALDRSMVLMPEATEPPTFDGAVLPPMANGGSHVGGVIAGWCLYDLGRPRAAAEVLEKELVRIPSSHRRAGARFGARRVLAYAAAGEVDHACALAHELLDIASVVDSATVRMEFRRLARALARWHTHQAVRELSPQLAAALRTPVGPVP
jgi:transcriptional regulator with XRE-family HTH domain